MIAWGISGGAARAIGLFQAAKVCMEQSEKPNIIIGTSSGALLAPIIAAAYEDEGLMDKAIQFAETLDPVDMFPYKNNKPFNKKGKPTINAIFRILGGHNHLGWQDIKPLYKKVFKPCHLDILRRSDIQCIAFGVTGKDGSPERHFLNPADTVNELIEMIERSSRMVPFVQSMNGSIDGGFISFNPAMWLFEHYDITKLITIYSHQIKPFVKENLKWDKSIVSVTAQTLLITTYWLGVKDSIIEEYYCKLNDIDYLRIECPDGYTDEVYESDDKQLIALGKASRRAALKAFAARNNKNNIT